MLQRDIGLKLFGFVTLSSLGIRVRKVAFSARRTLPEMQDSSTSFHTSSLKIGQQKWKKSIVKPSGPGALPVGNS
jgi:hypothetical protein